MKNEVPVYLVTGFLDSGKTDFIRDLLTSEDFCQGERTLFLRCEDGEEEYDEKAMEPFKVTMVPVEDQSEFTKDALKKLEKKHWPEQVVIEYNGMWPLSVLDDALPGNWALYQIVTIIDAGTFEMYSKNMGSLMMEKLINSDMILFNRCTNDLKAYLRSRNLKLVNNRAEIYLEDQDRNGEDYFLGGEPPFDMSKDSFEFDEDFGVFYVDVNDYPERYEDKTVKFKGIFVRSDQFEKGVVAVGRFAMVCCSEDLQFLGLVCKNADKKQFNTRDWVEVTGKIRKEFQQAFGEEGPALYVESIVPCAPPEQEIIGF